MRRWQKKIPPYEGAEPYLYFAFAESESARVWKLLKLLLERGCRVWYCCGPAGSAEELLHRQERAAQAALTVLYLTDAACEDKDTKSYVLVNQKSHRPILCLDPDGTDRRLSMGLREDTPHVPLYQLRKDAELESALLHAEGFSQDIMGERQRIHDPGLTEKLTAVLLIAALALLAVGFVGWRCFHWFRPPVEDEVTFSDPVILAAVREAAHGGRVTQELSSKITVLRLDALPESWEELSLLPALTQIELPQQALLEDGALPEGDYVISLNGGDSA